MKLLILFIVLNVVNVILQTAKNIATVKCGRTVAAIVNATAYGIYTVVLVYMNCDLALWQKVAIVAGSNLVGVYFVKFIEQKIKKDKLTKIEFSVNKNLVNYVQLKNELENAEISHNYTNFGKYNTYTCYCENKNKIELVKEIIKKYNAKYFASETKLI